MASLGWLFCEIAFRGWESLPDSAFADDDLNLRWWARPFDLALAGSYRLGCWFYGKAADA